MKRYIVGGIIGCLVAILVLGIAHYYTCFAYYLPHRPTIVEIAPNDAALTSHPGYISIPVGFNQTTVQTEQSSG